MGLALSVALAFLFTNGLKVLLGKPRPDMLARCDPDVANYQRYVVADYAREIWGPAHVLVSAGICRNPDQDEVDGGFKSFPSGHASGTLLCVALSSLSSVVPPFSFRARHRSCLHGIKG